MQSQPLNFCQVLYIKPKSWGCFDFKENQSSKDLTDRLVSDIGEKNHWSDLAVRTLAIFVAAPGMLPLIPSTNQKVND